MEDPSKQLSSMASLSVQEKKPTPFTTLAKKYGHPVGKSGKLNHKILKNTGKSGLTPLSPFPSSPGQRSPNQWIKRRLREYQQRRYFGFTAAELGRMESMAALNTSQILSTLENPIHPMFEKTKWDTESTLPKHQSFLPLLGGYEGLWQVDNPEVWEILRSPLQLASRLLVDASYWPWWDALFNGEYKPIENSRKPIDRVKQFLLSFHQRGPALRNDPEALEELQRQILEASEKIRFGLHSGYARGDTGMPYDLKQDHIHYGETVPASIYPYTKVWLGVEILQPLLRRDLTDAERITNCFRVATTLIHECAHAVWDTMAELLPNIGPTEPYFEDEPLFELGWSLEDKLWGGYGRDIVSSNMWQGGPGLPNMGILATKWFTQKSERNLYKPIVLAHKAPAAGEPDPYYCFDYWPVPVTYQTNLFQSEFWDRSVRAMGARATQFGPLSVGMRLLAEDREAPENYQIILQPAMRIEENLTQHVIHDGMTESEKAGWEFENKRRSQALLIFYSIATGSETEPLAVPPNQPKDPGTEAQGVQVEDEGIPDCPRWTEILNYLLNNRGPLELALDSLTFEIPEPTLYRYILNRGGLDISPTEWRAFLRTANHKGEYFRWTTKPNNWFGLVTRIPHSWPPNKQQAYLPPPPRALPSADDIDSFTTAWTDPNFLTGLYTHMREFRDVDHDTLRRIMNRYRHEPFHIHACDMEDLIAKFAAEGTYIVHGPVGIARVIHPIPENIKESVKREEESMIKEQEEDDDSSESEDSDMQDGRGEEDKTMQDNVDNQVLEEMDAYMSGALMEPDMDWAIV